MKIEKQHQQEDLSMKGYKAKMTKKGMVRQAHHKISAGMVHKIPTDLRKALTSEKAARAAWKDITPLARNEWICWVISGKKSETRNIRIEKALSKLKGGMRRPCCWAGCLHRF